MAKCLCRVLKRLRMDDGTGVVLITKVEEEEPGRQVVDCAVAPRYQILRCAFQQIQSTTPPAFLPVSERQVSPATKTGSLIEDER